MSTFRLSNLPLFVTIFLFSVSAGHAQATRTWISGVGDDVNPCSRTAPCKTFAGAISKTATGGEINCLDPGGFGAVTITKSITLDCTGTQGSILASGTTGIIINAPNAVVRLRSLTINGAGATAGTNGINVINARRVHVEGTVIDGFSTNGIAVICSGCEVVVANSTLRNNSTHGISIGPSEGTATAFVTRTLIAGNRTGVGAMNGTVRISGCEIVHNTTGIAAGPNGTIVSYKNNVIDANGTNGSPGSTVSLQ